MKFLAYNDYYDKALLDEAGSEFSFAPLTLGEWLTVSLRFFGRAAGQRVGEDLDIRSFHATIGKVGLAPTSGDWSLLFGALPITAENTSAALPFNVAAGRFAEAINATPAAAVHGTAHVTLAGASTWIVTFANNAGPVQMAGVSLRLAPHAFVRVRAFLDNGRWRHEVRLVQAPIATVDVAARVVPPGPTVTRVTAGALESGIEINEVQALTVPPTFLGTFSLKKSFAKTGQLDRTDFAEDVQAALATAYGANFKVTNPTDFVFHIEFTGDFSAAPQDLLVVTVETAPPGDWTFTLPLNLEPAYAAMRGRTEDEFVLAVDAMIAKPGDAPELPGEPKELLRTTVTLRNELRWNGLESAANIDWLRPPEPTSYVGYNPSQTIFGQQHYGPVAIGDGVNEEWVVAHNLGTEALSGIELRANAEGGRRLVHGADADFEIFSGGINATRIVFTVAPGVDDVLALFTAAGPKSAFVADIQIEIDQVTGLQTIIDGFGARISELEEFIPQTAPGTSAASGDALSVDFPSRLSILPRERRVAALLATLKIEGVGADAKVPAVDPAALPRNGVLLPAIHDAVVVIQDGSDALPAANTQTGIIQFTASSHELVGGDGYRTELVDEGGFAGSDGRRWRQFTPQPGTRTFNPTVFERQFFDVPISGDQLRIAATLELEFRLALQMLAANRAAQVTLVVDIAAITGDVFLTGSAAGLNLKAFENWQRAVSCPIRITGDLVSHRFGLRIKRALAGHTADQLLYGTWSAAMAAPLAPAFALRARIIEFDVENTTPGAASTFPLGYLYSAFYGGKLKITA